MPSRQSVIKPALAKIPESLRQPCQTAAALPERAMTGADVARFWAKDRLSLADCSNRHTALSGAVIALEGQVK
jgi:hypothetical protein